MSTNGIDSGQQPRPEPALSPEFLAGSTEAGLDKIRTRLLDLTNRHRLLNFRHSVASSLRVVQADLNAAFRCLLDGGKLEFVPVPEPDPRFDPDLSGEAGVCEKPPAEEYAKTLGWETSYDLDASSEGGNAASLPVLHYVEGLETLTRKIGSAAKTAIEESGTNMLYLILGFLEWYEADDSQQARLAPLLTVPVALERSGGKGKGFECTLEYSGEDFTTNLSLVEKMRRDFGVEIPVVEEEDTPEDYFARFTPLLKQKARWRIRRQITLSLLSFGKLLMYRDLDPKTWPAIASHAIVKELFEGTKSGTVTHAAEYPIDAPEIKSYVPSLILDADSSQHSALIDALQGRNLVIEGPPGTGKSQTITNLIAAALVNGKTVLFVSEKLAALEVVRRRLDEAGLGLFCLELHSHKTKKHVLLNDLAARLKAKGTFRDPRDLDQHQAAVEDRKRLLTQYAGLVNKAIMPFQATIFEVLWARDRYYQELPCAPQAVEHLLLPAVKDFTRGEFGEALQFLSVYGNHLAGITQLAEQTGEHPWSWVAKSLNFDDEIRLLDRLGAFSADLRSSIEVREALARTAALNLEEGIGGLREAETYLLRLPAPAQGVCPTLLSPCRDQRTRARLRGFIRDVEDARAFEAALAAASAGGDAGTLLGEEAGRRLAYAFQNLKSLGLEQNSAAQLGQLLDRARSAEQALSEAARGYAALQALLGSQLDFRMVGVDLVMRCLRLIENAPADVLHLRTEGLEPEGVRQLLLRAADEARALRQHHAELEAAFDLALAQEIAGAGRLKEHALAIEEAAFWQVWFGRAYRQAAKTYTRLSRKRARAAREIMSHDLRVIADYIHRRMQFDTQHHCREVLGPHFRGVESPWDDVVVLIAWYEEIFVSLPEEGHDFHDLLLRARAERLKAIKNQLTDVAVHREGLARLKDTLKMVTATFRLSASATHSLDDVTGALQAIDAQIEEALSACAAIGLREDFPLSQIPTLLDTAQNYRICAARVLADDEVRQLLGANYAGLTTDLNLLRATVDFAEAIDTSGLRDQSVQWILSEDYAMRLEQLRGQLASAHALGDTLAVAAEEIRTLSASARWPTADGAPLQSLLATVERALTHREDLPRWVHLLRLRAQAGEHGVDRLTVLADDGAIEPAHLVPAFRFVFYNTLARHAFAEHPALSEFSALTQDLVRRQFAESDRKAIALFRERAAALIDSRPVPYGNQSGPVGTWTDLALITKEINKQKRHIPIRQLVRRAGNALQSLKPCFMMGPLSVAQYLAPGEIHFDLIVMDEASQLKPEEAIGAIGRGAQIVIVGDPKQLPPTNFFQRVTMDADGQEDENSLTIVEEGESILDVASTLYQPVRRLRWHYRSRHHSLIAFSNREFYQGDLVIFPSAFQEDGGLGVKYHPVSGGVFESSRNPREAAVVVEAVLDHMREHPEESLGVVTLNFEQRELVEELLDQKLRTDPFAMAYQERMNAVHEPFFVKNLENVQGDERDVIFISVTYGPDARGNQYIRFGPINGANGHRRLNVLFTRAKRRVEVFSSLDPDRIQTTAGSPWGLRALKQYLTFARNGILEAPDDGGGQAESDFEKAVGAVLKERGYSVVTQVGVAGFFIDLAIRHPAKPGTFLLGVECDGASYHSGRSARDRDRLRQEILENLGWKIHRIWSTDWFKSRNTEIKRLLARIEDLLARDPDYQQQKQKAQRGEALRSRLVDLLDREIRPAFAGSDPERCLLRPTLMDEFIRRKPRSRDDWFRLITPELRSGTDPKQVGHFLPRVLEIINEIFED